MLFLDEAPEFATGVLDALRQPIERGEVEIHRAGAVTRYPCRFQLVLAANPCPCAASGSSPACTCTPTVRRRYRGRLSGPLLDRVDLQVEVQAPTRADLVVPAEQRETSAVVAARVAAARERARERLAGTGWRTNAEVPAPALHSRWRLPRPVVQSAVGAIERGLLTLRGYDRVLRLAWTLADLRGLAAPAVDEVQTALGLRLGREAA